ncbi:hypothetical protein [Lacicoccus alkaliphilus]|uniref:Uncharacterized protein n=1 Tax=Lacicoccus alkaliphilus DSM 16010 TaxID=1123231 RepID=A0A1M7HHC2_9BACL|nr:hypothetical protein [Salinicoccus alkaliphilus]SHM27537.1 hypothetical protein SAMN02745189_01856 [Salinicoccus alkaliphilus DSM 16010]
MDIKAHDDASRKDSGMEEPQSEVIELKSFSLDTSEGMMCDAGTGVCGPVDEEKEDEK